MSPPPAQPQPPAAIVPVPLVDDPDPTDLCNCTTTSLSSLAGEIIVLQVVGEVDIFTRSLLRSALTDSLDRQPGYLIIDLSRLTFCDVGGFRELVLAGVAATESGTGYAVSGCSTHLSRIWSIVWGAEVPTRYRSVPAAITGIRAGQTPSRWGGRPALSWPGCGTPTRR